MTTINRNQLLRRREAAKKVGKIIPSNKGYILTQDERILGRVLPGRYPVAAEFFETVRWLRDHMSPVDVITSISTEADLDRVVSTMDEHPIGWNTDGASTPEVFAMLERWGDLDLMEDLALGDKAMHDRMRKLLLEFHVANQTGKAVPSKVYVDLARLINETEPPK